MRLNMPWKQRSPLRKVRPFREPGAPPDIVLWDRVELGKVESDHPGTPRTTTSGIGLARRGDPTVIDR